jgi:hypothetical protein
MNAEKEETMVYTRGDAGTTVGGGPSMVEKHRSKLQMAKQEISMGKMKALFPNMRHRILEEALKVNDWAVEGALSLVEGFLSSCAEDLKGIYQSMEARKKEIAKESGLEDALEANDSDKKKRRRRSHRHEEDGEEERSHRRHRRKDRSRWRRRSRSRSRSADDEKSRGGSRRGSRYGKYGIIRETDMYEKRPEFMLWAMERRKVDVESMSRAQEKDLFKRYMEDYNTGTLAHRKYYNLAAYEASKRSRHGREQAGERTVFDDEAERRREIEQEREKEKARRLKEAYEGLQKGGKADAMREQELLRAKQDLLYRTGNVEEAEKIAQRLRGDP